MPFILLTTITVLLLFTLGLSPDKGFLKYKFANNDEKDEDNVTDNTTTEDIVIDEPSKTNLTSSVEVENMYNM
jgi:hypothetical protein